MTTPPNPEHLLRRPKKPVEKNSNTPLVAAGAATLVVASAIAAYVVFGHAKTAAGASPGSVAPAATTQVASVPDPITYAAPISSTAKHPAHKPGVPAKPLPGASATPQATATPATAPSPAASSHPAATAEIAKAKHQAALHLAALRRAQAAAQVNLGGSSVSNDSSFRVATNAQAAQPAGLNPPAPTQAPTTAPAPATPDAEPTPVYAPRVVVDARFIDRVSPAYPAIAREQGASGTAIVLATVGPHGNVVSVQIDQSTGNKLLDEAAVEAARSSRFQAPEIDGKPATETYRIVYSFDPNS